MKKTSILLFFIVISVSAQKTERAFQNIFNEFPHVRDFAMSTTQDEIYFTVESYKKEHSYITFIRKKNGKWSKPKVASFSGMYKDLEPFLSPNGLQLFFASNRVDNQSKDIKKDIDIWYVERASLQSNWSKPKNIGPIINTEANEYYPSVTSKGDLFFTAAYKDAKGKEDIYVSRFVNGKYTKPVSLGTGVNSEKYEFNAFVAPDESFIIYTSFERKDGFGGGDLYISFKNTEKEWMPAENLGKSINSKRIDFCPFIDLKTKTLYFTSDRSGIQKSFKKRKNIKQLQQIFKNNINGLGRMYKVDLSKILEKKRH
jgi:Tol biopolymer transport system component